MSCKTHIQINTQRNDAIQISQRSACSKWRKKKSPSHLIKVSDDLIQQSQALHSHVVAVQLDVEIIEVRD